MNLKNSSYGQATAFIIIAVLIFAAALIGFFLLRNPVSSEVFSSDPGTQAKFNVLKNSIDDCMKYTAQDSLDVIGIQGGYFDAPKDYYDVGWAFIPYYYDKGKFLMPTNSIIEQEIGKYVNEYLDSCFDEIDKQDFKMAYAKPSTDVKINKGEVAFTMDMPVTIERAGKVIRLQLRDQPIVVDSKLFDMIDIAKFITDGHKTDIDNICISCLDRMSQEKKLFIDMINFGDGSSTLISISNNDSESYPLVFEFLNKYG